jgi:hypothetical protein
MRRRREFLAAVGAGLAAALAGCADSGEDLDPPGEAATETRTETATETFVDPVPALDITDFRPAADDDGNLVVEVTVENVAGEAASATLRVRAIAGDRTETRETAVSLDAGAAETYSLTFGIPREEMTGFDPRLVPDA